MQTNGKQHYLGIFDTEEEASASYQCYKKSGNIHPNITITKRTTRAVKAVKAVKVTQPPPVPDSGKPSPAPPITAKSFCPPGTIFELEKLQAPGPFPDNIDVSKREQYLKDDVFDSIFSMTKDKFYALPKWKQQTMKKKVGLF